MDVAEIQRRSRAGSRALLARRGIAIIVLILSTVTIPRLVSPAAFGLATMSAVLLSLADTFKDLGVSSALLRKGYVSAAEANFLFWVNAASTIALAALLAALSPLAGVFFHQQRVTEVVLFSLLGFVASGLTLQHRSLLIRDLRFTSVAAIDTCTLLTQFIVTLASALIRPDVWAIVIGNLTSALLGACLYVYVGKWKPSRPVMIPEARQVFRFGLNASVYSLSVFISTNMASVLIGRVLGPLPLGQYNRANALATMPVTNAVEPIAQATLPALARLREMPDTYRSTYLDLLCRLNLLIIPAALMLALSARALVSTILGSRWSLAGYIIPFLTPSIAATGLGFAASDLFISQDRSDELRSLGIAEAVIRAVAIGFGVRFSLTGVAVGYSLSTVLVIFLRIYVAGSCGPVSFRDHLATVIPAAPVAIGTGVGCLAGLGLASLMCLSPPATAAAICSLGLVVGAATGILMKTSRKIILETVTSLGATPPQLVSEVD